MSDFAGIDAGAARRGPSTWWWRIIGAAVSGFAALLATAAAPSAIFRAGVVLGAVIAGFGMPESIAFFREFWARARHRRSEPLRHHRLATAPGLVFCALLGVILIRVLFWPVEAVTRYDVALTSIGAVLVLLGLPALYAWSSIAGRWLGSIRPWQRASLLGVFLVAAFLLQLRIGYALQVHPGWDVSVLLENAFRIADGSTNALSPYFSSYPNNLMLAVALVRFSQPMLLLGVPTSGLLYAVIVLNCVVLTATVLLVYLCARRLVNEGAAIFTLPFTVLFVVFSPYLSVVYTDSLGILFPVLLLYLYLTAIAVSRPAGKVALWATMGAVAAIGYNLKPTVTFAFIAILAVYVLERLLARQSARTTARALLAVLLSAGLGFGAAYVAIRADVASRPYAGPEIIRGDEAVPLTHFLAMGATGHGGYSRADIRATRAITDPQERFRHGIDLYLERVGAMGYPGYLQFLADKASWTFGDGSFYSWGEGDLREQENPFPVHDPVSGKVQSYLWINGEKFPLAAGVWQSVWLALLALVVAPLWVRSPRLMSSNAAIMRWALLALTLFLLLFETRSRYLYLYLPFFILLGTLTVDALGKRHPSFMTGMHPVVPSARDGGAPVHGAGTSGR